MHDEKRYNVWEGIIRENWHEIFDKKFNDAIEQRVNKEFNEKKDALFTKGFEMGQQEGYERMTSSIKNLMKALKMTVEEALDLLKITGEERVMYKDML